MSCEPQSEIGSQSQAASIDIAVERPTAEDARWCLGRYMDELTVLFEEGFNPAKGNSVSDAEMSPPNGWLLIARLDGRPIGCAALVRRSHETGEIKRMWTSPQARGQGVARRMLRRLEEVAGEAGFQRVVLDTNRALKAAQDLYRRQGYFEIARYNDNPYADHWFEKRF